MCCAYIWQPHPLEVRDRYAFWQWKWNEGGLCPTWRQELGPMPGTGRVLFCPWAHTICLFLLRKPTFPSYAPRGGASAGSGPWMGLGSPAGQPPGQPVVHLSLRGTALTKSLAHFGNPFSFALPNKINLKRLGSSDIFSHVFIWRGKVSWRQSPDCPLVSTSLPNTESALHPEAHTWEGEFSEPIWELSSELLAWESFILEHLREKLDSMRRSCNDPNWEVGEDNEGMRTNI